MKIAHFADIHIGANIKRLGELGSEIRILNRKAFSRAIEKALDHNPDVILISGDLFDTNIDNVKIDDLYKTMEILEKAWEKGVPIIGIEGNHEYYRSLKAPDIVDIKSPLRLLERQGLLLRAEYLSANVMDPKIMKEYLEDVRTRYKRIYKDMDFDIVLKQIPGSTEVYEKYIVLDNTAFVGLQYVSINISVNDALTPILRLLEGISRIDYGTEKKVLMLHQTIEGIVTKDLIQYLGEQAISIGSLPKGFNYYALGHIHKYTTRFYGDAPVVYPGIISPTGRDEFDYYYDHTERTITKLYHDKGFVVYDLENDDEPRRIRIKSLSSIRIKILVKKSDNAMEKVRSAVRSALLELNNKERENPDSEVINNKPGVSVEIKYEGDIPLEATLISNRLRDSFGVLPAVNVEYVMEQGSGSYDREKGYDGDRDLDSIIREAFGGEYATFLEIINNLGAKEDLRLEENKMEYDKALESIISIIISDEKEKDRIYNTVRHRLLKLPPALLSKREEEEEQEKTPEKTSDVKKEQKREDRGSLKKPRSLFDYT